MSTIAAGPESPATPTPAGTDAHGSHEAEITWLTGGEEFSDYRPVFSPDGRAVLFERTPPGGLTTLYILRLDGGEPEPFLKDAPPEMAVQTRPDWCRETGEVAFCANGGPICVASHDGTRARVLEGTAGMIYPSWSADGLSMAVMSNLGAPWTALIDRGGQFLQRLTPAGLYAGMPTLSHGGPHRLAFPGQLAMPPYNQLHNQIYIADDPTAARKLDGKQGRAPWWSPDGELLAFESCRETGNQSEYAIYVATADGSHEARITDPKLNTQHPKFSPDGRRIVLAGQRHGTGPGKSWAIGMVSFGR